MWNGIHYNEFCMEKQNQNIIAIAQTGMGKNGGRFMVDWKS